MADSASGPDRSLDMSRTPRSALMPRTGSYEDTTSPRSGSAKVVTIAEPESISPMMRGKNKEIDPFDLDASAPKQHRASVSGKRLSGRPPIERPGSKSSLRGSPSIENIADEISQAASRPNSRHNSIDQGLLAQITKWVQQERARRTARKTKSESTSVGPTLDQDEQSSGQLDGPAETQPKRLSDSSEGSVALDQLQALLDRTMNLNLGDRSSGGRQSIGHRLSSIRKLGRRSTAASSDNDVQDTELVVPSCDTILDNSKTMSYTGGGADDEGREDGSKRKDKEAWNAFKYEIVRLTHTLRLKGWRRVPLEKSGDIEVERLSGALTNAVYVVTPPKNISSRRTETDDGTASVAPSKPPNKLLLRIYGPQVEHLIDREAELQILRRLARKHIGPRLLGTFNNGRFEQFLHARTLTPKDLRDPETSKKIAKRMRELHEGIDLLAKEREDGAFVWRNWDKWVERCEQVITWLDKQILEPEASPTQTKSEAWKKRGLICGVEWHVFRQTVEKYRKWLDAQYGGSDRVKERLVFAHNDAQYGNILRLVPEGESPLLHPANEHKQLVVIDFEYANANLPGLEFANHFTEWCYNYHDPNHPHLCDTTLYPTPHEQRRFIRAYVLHDPPHHPSTTTPVQTPSLHPTTPSSSSLSVFMLDSRTPTREQEEKDAKEDERVEKEVERLIHETRLWRLANSAQWVAWGIVQAKVEGLPAEKKGKNKKRTNSEDTAADKPHESMGAKLLHLLPGRGGSDPLEGEEVDMARDMEDKRPDPEEGTKNEEDEEEFDYLAYAQSRAMFFWGDAVALGVVDKEELPEGLGAGLREVEF